MAEGVSRVTSPNHNEDPRLADLLEVIFKFAAGDLTARGTLSDDESALDGVMAGINILGEELEANVAGNKQAQEASLESENRLRTVLESVQAGIVIIDPEAHRIVDVNSFAVRMIGAPKESIIGAVCHKFICPAEWDQCPVTNLHQTVDNSERVLLTATGERRDIIKTVTAIQLGGRSHLLESFIDVTERKRTEEALRANEESYRQLFESSRDALMTLAPPSWRFTSANQATLELFGAASTAAFTELGPWKVSPERQPDGRSSDEKAQEMIATAMREGKNFFEWEHQRLDGSPFPADVLLTRMDVGGEVFLQATVRDITERKRAEQALSESEALLRTIFDSVQDGILLAEVQSQKFIMVNDSICRMLGYSRDELLELGVEDIHPEKDVGNVVLQMARLAKNEISLAPNLPVKRKDGTVFHADINGTTIQVKGISFLVGVFRDITERQRAEQAEELASRDGLTNLYNHRRFYSFLKDEIIRTQRFNRPVSLLMLDIDHFKRVNDTYGHQAGDAIIKGLSDLQVQQARTVDRVCRYGGEEFMVILPETDATMAMQIAERLRATVERQPFDIGGGMMVRITVSIGVATYPQQANALEEFVKAADLALYAAKEGGRNRVTRYEAAMAGKD